jgi:hypothetical protein
MTPPFEFELSTQMAELAKGEGPQAELAREMLDGQRRLAEEIERAQNEGDWEQALMLTGSEDRAAVLVRALRASSDDQARELMAHWFNLLDAMHDHVGDLREQFERLGFVTDDLDGKMPDLPVTVYRAQWGNDPVPVAALSWTARRDVAERFARYLTGPRAWFLGIKRDDDEPWIWQATCHEAYGWFISRDEEEIAPKRLTDLQPISKLITVPPEEES